MQAVYGHVINKFSGMGRFTYPWYPAGELRAPELRHYTFYSYYSYYTYYTYYSYYSYHTYYSYYS